METLTPEIVREKGKDLVEEIEIIRDASPIKLGNVKLIDAGVKGNSVYVKLKADGKEEITFFDDYIRYLRIFKKKEN